MGCTCLYLANTGLCWAVQVIHVIQVVQEVKVFHMFLVVYVVRCRGKKSGQMARMVQVV